MIKSISLLVAIFVLFTSTAFAEEPDFYISFQSCKILVGYLTLSDESLRIGEGDPTTMACFRRGQKIRCVFDFQSGSKGVRGSSENYEIIFDSPPLLHFTTSGRQSAEFLSVNTQEHAAVLINRIVDKQFAGAKVCQGIYLTDFEMKNLKK
jgi:hypothetical protein